MPSRGKLSFQRPQILGMIISYFPEGVTEINRLGSDEWWDVRIRHQDAKEVRTLTSDIQGTLI